MVDQNRPIINYIPVATSPKTKAAGNGRRKELSASENLDLEHRERSSTPRKAHVKSQLQQKTKRASAFVPGVGHQVLKPVGVI